MWIMDRLPLHRATSTVGMLANAIEIPLALSVLAEGGPAGAAAALLFAGPAINLPSLLVIGRYSSLKVALALALLVWAVAAGGGLLLG
jgi:uncharacterized membrane protein YraQ (UPF0718 family)